MAIFSGASRTVVIKANRETIGLVVVATALTFALAYSIHSRPGPTTTVAPAQSDWTGQLADVAPSTSDQSVPFKSADLVVPSSQLALPALPAKPRHACDEANCAKVPLPPARRTVTRSGLVDQQRKATEEAGLLSTLNPLNHVPSLSAIGKPFTYAGDVVGGWFKRF